MSCDCPICYEVIGDNNSTTTSCGHKFHASCLIRSIMSVNKLCPCCRNPLAETQPVPPQPVRQQLVQRRVMTPDELENVCLGNELRYIDFINKFFKLNKSASIREKTNIYIPLEEFKDMYFDALKRHVRYYRVTVDNDEGTVRRVAENILFIVESTMTQKWNDAKKASMKSQREHRKRVMEVINI
jgi:hypothetical protein